jgi:hypothetical protein
MFFVFMSDKTTFTDNFVEPFVSFVDSNFCFKFFLELFLLRNAEAGKILKAFCKFAMRFSKIVVQNFAWHIFCDNFSNEGTGTTTIVMKKNSTVTKVFLYQHLGFLAIIALCYLDELLKLPSLIFSGHPFVVLYRRPILEMLLILAVWFLVASSTRRLLKRVRQLEDFMRVCAWCRKIDYKGQWMPLEEFMQQGFDTPTTHGICPECLCQQEAMIEKAKQARKDAMQSPA